MGLLITARHVCAQQGTGGTISGQVITKLGTPLGNISINVNASMGSFSSWTMTDSAGNFAIGGLPAGRYCVNASNSAFLMLPDANQCNYTVAEGATLSGITLIVEQGGVLSGAYTSQAPQDSLFDNGFEIALFADSLMGKNGQWWESWTTWANVYNGNNGTFVSGAIPAGSWRLLFRPSHVRLPLSTMTQPFIASRSYAFVTGASLSSGAPIAVTPGDTLHLTGVNFGKGYSVFGRVSLENGESNVPCRVTAFIKDGIGYVPVASSSVASDSLFELPGLIDNQDYFIRVDAPNYPEQFWSAAQSNVQPVVSYHFSIAGFIPPNVHVLKIPQGFTAFVPSLNAWWKNDSGGLRILCNVPTTMGFDTLLLYGTDDFENRILLAAFPNVPQQSVYSWKETRDPSHSSFQYVFVARGVAGTPRSNVVFYYPAMNKNIPSDSLAITVMPARNGVQINWAAESSFVVTNLDTTVLYRKRTGETAWSSYQKALGAQSGFFDGSWDKTKDLGVIAWYQLKMSAAGKVIKQSSIVSFTATQEFIHQMADQLSVGPHQKYTTIQQAVDAAMDFDIINVDPGTYRENIDLKGKMVSLQGNWTNGEAPIIDGNGGVAVTIPYTSKSFDRDCIAIGGFKISNCLTGIASAAVVNVNQCLFVNIVREALQCCVDSTAVAVAAQTDPFAQFYINQNVWQCTFIGSGSSGIALRAYSKTGGTSFDSMGLISAGPMTPGGHIGVNNSLFAYYASPVVPADVKGRAFSVDVHQCDFWKTSTIPSSSQVIVGSDNIAVDPAFIDTINYFLADTSRLKAIAAVSGYYGYDARRYYNGKDNLPTIPAITNFKAVVAGPRKVALSWSPLPDSVKIDGYVVFRVLGYDSLFFVGANSQWQPKVPDSLMFSILDSFRTSATSFIDSTLTIGTPYIYAVAGIATGNMGQVNMPFPPPLSAYIIKIDPPSSIPSISGSVAGFSAIAVQWKKPSYAKTASPTYSLCRMLGGKELLAVAKDSAAVRSLVRAATNYSTSFFYSTNDTAWFDTTVVMGGTYLYAVSVADSGIPFEQRPIASIAVAFDSALYAPAMAVKLVANRWAMIGPWGIGSIPLAMSPNSAVYRWEDTKTPDKLYSQYVAADALQSCAGYWVTTGVDTVLNVSAAMYGNVIQQRDSIRVSLVKGLTGWNQIASPFPFAIAPAWLDGKSFTAYSWDADSSQYVEQARLTPWQAFWLHVDRDTQLVFRALDLARGANGPLLRKNMAASWELKISLTAGCNDPDNYIGVVPARSAKSMRCEYPKPPAAFDFPQLYLVNGLAQPSVNEKLAKLYKVSTVVPSQKLEWTVGVSPATTAAKIRVHGVKTLPEKVFLYWISAASAINLRDQQEIDVEAHGRPLYGYIVATADPRDLSLYTNRVELRKSFPNPFRTSATIQFTVPYAWNADGSKKEGETRDVSLAMFDLSGRRVATLLSGKLAVGEHRFVWNGTSDAGKPTSPGVLITRLSGSNFQKTMKIFKLR